MNRRIIPVRIIPVRIEYSSSLEKWRGIRKFAKDNKIDTNNIDRMIAKIERVGDASLEKSYTFEINNLEEFFYSIYSSDEHPCPHCYKYMCSECPMDDDTKDCCKEWSEVKRQMLDGR